MRFFLWRKSACDYPMILGFALYTPPLLPDLHGTSDINLFASFGKKMITRRDKTRAQAGDDAVTPDGENRAHIGDIEKTS